MRATVRSAESFNPKSRAFEALRLLTGGKHPSKGPADDGGCHRVAVRLELVTTSSLEDTREALSSLLPKEEARSIRRLLSELGSSLCTERAPRCSSCPLASICPRLGVSDAR